jgi:hemerythrin superfamily protein
MADTKIRIRKATSLLKEDHRKVKKLFAEFDKLDESDTAEMARIFETVKKEITTHAEIEEEIFYPAIQRADEDEAEELIREAREEHRLVKMLIDELSGMTADEEQFCAKMKVLKDNILHHAEEEESEIFPVFEGLDKEEQDRVADELNNRKNEISSEEED